MRIQYTLHWQALCILTLCTFVPVTFAGPLTELINTESIKIIDDISPDDISLQFGNTLVKTLTYERSNARFSFNDDVYVQGDLQAAGNLSGSSLTVSGLQNCDTIDTDASGTLVCGTDATGVGGGGITQAAADVRYVNITGDTMTGDLDLSAGAGITAAGNIETQSNIGINSAGLPQDAVLTFGNILGDQDLLFSNVQQAFIISNNFLPEADVTYNLGSESNRWSNIYSDGLTVDNGSVAFGSLTGALLPNADLAYDIGAPNNRWDKIYADSIVLRNPGEPTVLDLGNQGGIVLEFNNAEAGAGYTIATGSVLKVDTTTGNSVVLTQSKNDEPIGVAVNGSVFGGEVSVLLLGKIDAMCTGTIDIGELVQTSNTDGVVEAGNSANKVVGKALTNCNSGIVNLVVYLR